MVLFVCFMGCVFTSISSFFTLAGIVGGVFISFIIPGMFALKTNYAKTLASKAFLYTFLVTFIIVGVLGTAFSIKEFKLS